MLDQQFMDNTLRNEMDRFNSENKLITKVSNEKWKNFNLYEILNQFNIEFEGDEKANKNNFNCGKNEIIKVDEGNDNGKHDDGELREYLDKIYHQDDNVKAKRNEAIQWIEKQVKMWLNKQCSSVGIKYQADYSMIVGGSSLLETATSDSDLDIIFLLPNRCLIPNEVKECNECKLDFNSGRFCQEHDFIFGDGVDTFNSTMKKLENDMEDLKVFNKNYVY
uniref:Polymerase nucleotidyl transferase domain-containing protein n=1 Tax=Meloidogyne incognita TaxID=6306 RepID=A0A914M513_MELIC